MARRRLSLQPPVKLAAKLASYDGMATSDKLLVKYRNNPCPFFASYNGSVGGH